MYYFVKIVQIYIHFIIFLLESLLALPFHPSAPHRDYKRISFPQSETDIKQADIAGNSQNPQNGFSVALALLKIPGQKARRVSLSQN